MDAQQVPRKDVAVCAPVLSQCVVTDAAGYTWERRNNRLKLLEQLPTPALIL